MAGGMSSYLKIAVGDATSLHCDLHVSNCRIRAHTIQAMNFLAQEIHLRIENVIMRV